MKYVIEMLGITKGFPGIIANDNITLQLKKGEIHALLGENGAGKSTLMSILFGLYQPDKGEIRKNGNVIKIYGPNDATQQGIGMVHQHFKLVQNFTVLENIILGVETTRGGVLQIENACQKVVALSKQYGLKVNPNRLVADITVGMQQRVEILKMLYRESEILIFDEPSAVLTPQEIDELMKIMRELANKGKSILFITHKLDEIKAVANRCSVLRKGKYIGTVEVALTSKEELSEMMVGRKVNLKVEKGKVKTGAVILEVKGLTVQHQQTKKKIVNNVTFQIKAGEIVCLAGIDGNGQSELVQTLAGMMAADTGQILLLGTDITNSTIRKRGESGMAHIPEDRHRHGLILDYNLAYNTILQNYYTPQFQKRGLLQFNKIKKHANMLIDRFDIRSGEGADTIVRSMSGGNQQKIIIAREIDRNPNLLIAVQPTRGLDVGAIEFIHRQLVQERDQGKAVLLVSLEMDEVMNVSDRILVMYEGELVANLNPQQVTYQELGLYMAGSKREVLV